MNLDTATDLQCAFAHHPQTDMLAERIGQPVRVEALPVIQDGQYKRRMSVRRAAVVGGLVSIMGAYLVFLVIHGEKVKSILQIAGGGK